MVASGFNESQETCRKNAFKWIKEVQEVSKDQRIPRNILESILFVEATYEKNIEIVGKSRFKELHESKSDSVINQNRPTVNIANSVEGKTSSANNNKFSNTQILPAKPEKRMKKPKPGIQDEVDSYLDSHPPSSTDTQVGKNSNIHQCSGINYKYNRRLDVQSDNPAQVPNQGVPNPAFALRDEVIQQLAPAQNPTQPGFNQQQQSTVLQPNNNGHWTSHASRSPNSSYEHIYGNNIYN